MDDCKIEVAQVPELPRRELSKSQRARRVKPLNFQGLFVTTAYIRLF